MTDAPERKTPAPSRNLFRRLVDWCAQMAANGRRAWRAIPRRVRRAAMITALAILGTVVGTQLAGSGDYKVGPLDVHMSLGPSWYGSSTVEVPPLGALSADTHDGPVALNARIRQLDEDETRHIIENPQQLDAESKQAVTDVESALKNLVLRASIAGILMAALLGLITFRSLPRALLTALLATALIATTLGTAWVTRKPESIREPHYEGLLSNAPAVIGNARDISDRFGEYRGALIKLITNFSRVYTNLSNLPPGYEPDPNTIRVLHVSDLHLNPASFDVIKPIAEQFAVDAVVDTGDITDWGSNFENQYADNISQLQVPYVFVRGNHDGQQTADAVAAQPNAIVLEDQVLDIAGLQIAGIGDPRYTPDKSQGNLSKREDEVHRISKQLAKTIKEYDKTHARAVDFAMIHDPAGAKELADETPLVLAGHKHKRSTKNLDSDTVLRIEGSTGAAGVRGLYNERPSPFDMSVLYFTKEGELQVADEITISGADRQTVSLNRTIIKNSE